MPSRRKTVVSTDFPVEKEDGTEIVFTVTATLSPYTPARLNPVDLAHPAEGGDVEDITLQLNGAEISVADAVLLGLDQEKLDQHVRECADERDYYEDESYYEDERDEREVGGE